MQLQSLTSQESSDYSLNQDYCQSVKVKKQGCDFIYFVDLTFAHTSVFYQEKKKIRLPLHTLSFHIPSLFIPIPDGLFLLLTLPVWSLVPPSVAYFVAMLVYMLFAM